MLIWTCAVAVDDAFILYLFEIIEGASEYVDGPYNHPVIRVLVRAPICCFNSY